MIDLEGGPGASALMDWGPYITKATAPRYVGDHDFILLDQRGTGYSQPSLACPELSQPAPSSKSPPTPKQVRVLALAAVRRCHDRLIRAGVDLNAYTRLEDAADVADLRTPSNGAMTVQTLSHGYLIVFPGIGHGVRFSNPCTNSIVWSFLDNPVVSPDASCILSMKDPWS